MPRSIKNKIFTEISKQGEGWVFTPNHFLAFGPRKSVDMALSRLVEAGAIRRLARGVYDFPEKHLKLGLISPSPDAIAKAIRKSEATRLQPSGAYAANLLGLSEQVPAKIVFLTDGAEKTVRVGKQTIQLKRTTPKNMATAGTTSGLVIQAFRYLGKNHVKSIDIFLLRDKLSADDRARLWKDRVHAPAWMHPHLEMMIEKLSEEAKLMLDKVTEEIRVASTHFELVLALFGSDENISIVNNSAPTVFRNIRQSLLDSTIIRLTRLCDPEGKNENKNIGLTALRHSLNQEDQSFIAGLEALEDQIKSEVAKLKNYRNKILAHNDLKTYKRRAHRIIKNRAIDTALKLLEKYVNKIYLEFEYSEGSILDIPYPLGDGPDRLMGLIADGIKRQDEEAGKNENDLPAI